MMYNNAAKKSVWSGRITKRGPVLLAFVLAALALWPARCAKPTGPSQFVTIQLLSQGDSITYTGVPLTMIAVFDSAVRLDEISWTSGRGTYTRPGNHRPEDTTSADTILLTWEQMPVRVIPAPSDTAARNRPPIDTVWVEYRGNASNRIRVAVVNRAPRIDSVYVNGRKSPLLNDSLRISGNHSAIVYMRLFATDPDTGSELEAEWVGAPGFGSMVKFEDSASLNPVQRTMAWRWNINWQAPSVQSGGDSTITSTASFVIHDREGGVKSVPIRITIYRESGSIWVASTHENTSTLIKYAGNGTELFRVPGFQQINCLAVSPKEEVVWFTDRAAGKVYCVDDDGNMRYAISGFNSPSALDVSDVYGYCIVADKDSAVSIGSRVRVVNNFNKGRIDTSIAALKLPGGVSAVKIDQNEVNDFWLLWQVPSIADSTDKAAHYTSWWTPKSLVSAGALPTSIDLNPMTGNAWIAELGGNRVLRINTKTDSVAARITGFRNPQMLAVNTRDSSCWVVDTDHNKVVRLAGNVPNNYDINTGTLYDLSVDSPFSVGFLQPQAIAVNPNEGQFGVVWVVDTQNNRIVKLDSKTGDDLLAIAGFGMETPRYIAVNTGTR